MANNFASTRELQEAIGEPCAYCKRTMDIKDPFLMPTRDHQHPRSLGGRKIVFACYACNHLKADMTMPEWEALMAAYPKWWHGVPKTNRPPQRPATAKIIGYDDTKYILTHGMRAWRARKLAEDDPLVRAVLERFPGARIVGISHNSK